MAAVVSIVLLVTGVTTLLHMFVGTRLSTCAGSILCIPGSCPCDHQLTRILCVVACLEHDKCFSHARLVCFLLAVLTELNNLHFIAEF
jgi:hypothetical protein